MATPVVLLATCATSAFGVEGRAYELVSPVFKAGNRVEGLLGVAPNGETAAYSAPAAFEGEPTSNGILDYYLARRGSSQWTTEPMEMPATVLPLSFVEDFSPTFQSALLDGKPGPSEGWAGYEGQEYEYRLRNTFADGQALPELIGEILKPLATTQNFSVGYVGANGSFSHVVFQAQLELYLLKEAVETRSVLYDLTSAATTKAIKLVEVNNSNKAIDPGCTPTLGTESGRRSQFNAVSADGEEVFFSVGVTGIDEECTTAHQQVFVRFGGGRTVEVSRPVGACSEVPCVGASERAPAEYQGADEAGDRVFFTTTAPLAASDKDMANDLYMAAIGCPAVQGQSCKATQRTVTSLEQLSQGAEPADVQGVMAVAPDGSHVYFVARGALTAAANDEGIAPIRGADNLYVWRSGAPLKFVADLCSGPGESGQVEDPGCPESVTTTQHGRNDVDLWTAFSREAQVNVCSGASTGCEDGRFLLFGSYGKLTRDDTDSARDIYRYDAESGRLTRVSSGANGADANGNDDAFDVGIPLASERFRNIEQHGSNSRAISEDGSRVVFTTTEPLAPGAVGGVANVYEWHEAANGNGVVSLVTPGVGDHPVEQAVMSASGNDVFFVTTQGLVPQDTDGQADIYDARVGGGFPIPPLPAEPCSGDGCQGPLTNPAPLLVPASAVQAPEETQPSVTANKAKVKSKPAKAKKMPKGNRKRRKGSARRRRK